jgi:hypothetical protein
MGLMEDLPPTKMKSKRFAKILLRPDVYSERIMPPSTRMRAPVI